MLSSPALLLQHVKRSKMSQDGGTPLPTAARKKGDKPGKIQLQNVVPLIDCWAVIDTPLDFSFMKLATPAGRQRPETSIFYIGPKIQ